MGSLNNVNDLIELRSVLNNHMHTLCEDDSVPEWIRELVFEFGNMKYEGDGSFVQVPTKIMTKEKSEECIYGAEMIPDVDYPIGENTVSTNDIGRDFVANGEVAVAFRGIIPRSRKYRWAVEKLDGSGDFFKLSDKQLDPFVSQWRRDQE